MSNFAAKHLSIDTTTNFVAAVERVNDMVGDASILAGPRTKMGKAQRGALKSLAFMYGFTKNMTDELLIRVWQTRTVIA